jgi:hypothetical protein
MLQGVSDVPDTQQCVCRVDASEYVQDRVTIVQDTRMAV